MKSIYFIAITLLLLTSCKKETPGTTLQPEVLELQNEITLSIDGQKEMISFDCLNAPSLYSLGFSNDESTSKYVFEQGFLGLPLSDNQKLIYQFIIYTEENIQNMDMDELISLIQNDPEILQFEIGIKTEDKIYKNQFYDLSGFNLLYEERNIVSENETIDITIGNINSFDCVDNRESLELNTLYTGIIKTEDELDQKSISIEIQSHLYRQN